MGLKSRGRGPRDTSQFFSHDLTLHPQIHSSLLLVMQVSPLPLLALMQGSVKLAGFSLIQTSQFSLTQSQDSQPHLASHLLTGLSPGPQWVSPFSTACNRERAFPQ